MERVEFISADSFVEEIEADNTRIKDDIVRIELVYRPQRAMEFISTVVVRATAVVEDRFATTDGRRGDTRILSLEL